MISTSLTRGWGIRHPIILAPMAGVGGGELAGAVSAAGGFGFIGVSSTITPEWIAEQASLARTKGRFGIGMLVWALKEHPELLDAAIEQGPFAIEFMAGDPSPYMDRARAAGAQVVAQIQDADGARQAIAAGADVLVAQGTEAGGHTGSVGTLPLLQELLEIGEEAGVPVLAAGGIATGRGVAGVLAMGAAGAWIGTRFVASREAMGAPEAKEAVLRATSQDTIHTHVFDIAQRAAWPDELPGRALRNAFTARWHGREEELQARLDEVLPVWREARTRGDYSEAHVYAGQAVGLIRDLPSAGEIVRRLSEEAEAVLRRSQGLVVEGEA